MIMIITMTMMDSSNTEANRKLSQKTKVASRKIVTKLTNERSTLCKH